MQSLQMFHRDKQGFERNISFAELKNLIDDRSNELPMPVINATVLIDDDLHHFGSRLINSVFEFTPNWYGSGSFGYFQYGADTVVNLTRAVSISGAALDNSTIAGSSQKTLLSALNQDLGFYIDTPPASDRIDTTPRPSDKPKEFDPWHWSPFPFYMRGKHYLRDKDGTCSIGSTCRRDSRAPPPAPLPVPPRPGDASRLIENE
jgi:hypothetical protein